jgi:ribosomal protein S6--L-glutamate ligase
MRIGILCSPDSWYLGDLRRAAGDRHTITPLAFRQLAAQLGPTDSGRLSCGSQPLTDFDALLVRTMPPAPLEQVVFRMDQLARCEAAGIPVVNPAKAIEAAVDKYLTTARLAEAGLRVPRTVVCQTVEDGLAGFQAIGGDVVLKPLFGGEGRGIARLDDEAMAQRAFSLLASLGAVIYLQEFIDHPGHDLRVLLIGRRAWMIRRRNELDWRTNLSRGAVAEPVEPTAEIVELARRAAAAVGASVAGVDLLPDADGNLHVIEVNAVPGWKATAAALGVDIAACLLDYVAGLARGEEFA